MRDRSNHWSEDHRWFLFWAAGRVNRWLVAQGLAPMDPWDLVIAGWLRCARRAKDRSGLRFTTANIVKSMTEYAIGFVRARRRDQRIGSESPPRRFDEPGGSVDAIDALTFIWPRVTRPRSAEAAAWMVGHDLTCHEAGRKMGVSHETCRTLKNEFLAEARDILGSI